ncbi:MAG: hypothetical protein M3Z85_22875, partial [Acidobacteriota bacterium]|nr:hypothetical protein [Acidobacteriota bacterium]
MASDGRSAVFFDTCNCRGCSIDQHAQEFAAELAALRYDDGSSVDLVDVVAHSMGGLIVRAYLSGKTATAGVFVPPPDPKIRKLIFVATPHFGLTSFVIDTETRQLQIGSDFIWDQATWNQGTDDLRGVDAMALAGNGGSSHGNGGFDDGIVPITSASLSFLADASRTRVIPYCHNNGFPFVIECRSGAAHIARMDSASHPTAIAIRSFLAGTSEWQSVGKSAAEDPILTRNGGLVTSLRDAGDKQVALTGVKATGQSDASQSYTFSTNTANVFFREFMVPQQYTLTFQSNASAVQASVNVPGGGMRALPVKVSPTIVRAYPSAAALNFLSLAPGMLVSIYGVDLANATVLLNGQTLQVLYNNNAQINAVFPPKTTGLAKLLVRNAKGEHAINVMIEPAVPAIFSLDESGTGAAAATNAVTGAGITTQNPIRAGQFLALYATGLGDTQTRGSLDYSLAAPTALIAGIPARVLFAGRAPGFVGLDQINVEVPAGIAAGSA